ncbi:hypothetical protein [Clostridium sp.]|uniref:hypothetical protein n=1 Tax=Clostridium sp. TaxID=1506 RepID=UPI0032171743
MIKSIVKLTCVALILVTGFYIFGCNNKEKDVETSNISDKVITNPGESGVELKFQASYVRTGGYSSEKEYPMITICKTLEELKAHEGKVSGVKLLSAKMVSESSVQNIEKKYDEDFFKSKALIAITLKETSGSIRHEVEKVLKNNDEITVYIGRNVPKIGTMDMAEWTIYVEVNSKDVDSDDIVSLVFRNI